MEQMVLKVNVPTSARSKYYTGMTMEMLEQPDLPPAKGIWLNNHDRLCKITCQLERTGSFTPEEEMELTEFDQPNMQIGPMGVISDETGNLGINEMFSAISLQGVTSEEEFRAVDTSPPESVANFGWDDRADTSTKPRHVESETPCTVILDSAKFRKRSQFNGRPYNSWGNLFPPLYGSKAMPLAPMTEKLWWQIATDNVPADTNTFGVPKPSLNKEML